MPVLFGRANDKGIKTGISKGSPESRLRKNYNLYESLLHLLDELNICFVVTEAQTGKIIFVNDAFCRLSKYSSTEIFEMHSFLELIHEQRKDQVRESLSLAAKQSGSVKINSVLIGNDGRKNNVEVSARQIILNKKKQHIIVLRDISEIVNTELMHNISEKVLKESEQRYSSMIEKVKDYAIFILDSEGNISSWNAGAERITGFTENEVMMKSFSKLVTPDNNNESSGNKQNFEALFKKAKTEQDVESEVLLTKKNGSKFWALVSIARSNKNNFSIIVRDLTLNKLAEEQIHEQQIQLRSLAAHLQNAREEERLRIARELHDEFSQMLTVLRMDLTVLSRMVSKTITEPVKRISLIEKISSLSELLEKTIKSTRRIITELRPAVLDELGLFTAIQWQAQEFENRTGIRCKIMHLPYDINLDKQTSTAIFRILQEGLTNVAKHSEATNVIINLNLISGNVILKISDNGKGIDSVTIKAPTSTGLLGIRERVMALGGQFEITSEKARGTTLLISVPYKSEQRQQAEI